MQQKSNLGSRQAGKLVLQFDEHPAQLFLAPGSPADLIPPP